MCRQDDAEKVTQDGKLVKWTQHKRLTRNFQHFSAKKNDLEVN